MSDKHKVVTVCEKVDANLSVGAQQSERGQSPAGAATSGFNALP